jgi:hypothetical protein
MHLFQAVHSTTGSPAGHLAPLPPLLLRTTPTASSGAHRQLVGTRRYAVPHQRIARSPGAKQQTIIVKRLPATLLKSRMIV